MDESSTELGGYFPLTAIRSLLFTDQTLEGIPILSKSSGDTAKVLAVPYELGRYIAQLDSKEELFHVELFLQDVGILQHGELWLSFEWRDSNTRRTRLKGVLSIEKAIQEKRQRRLKEIIEELPPQMGASYNAHIAELCLSNLMLNKLDKVIQALNIAELLAKYEKEDNEMDHTQINKTTEN